MRVYELRALRRLPAASMLPAGSRRAPPEAWRRAIPLFTSTFWFLRFLLPSKKLVTRF